MQFFAYLHQFRTRAHEFLDPDLWSEKGPEEPADIVL